MRFGWFYSTQRPQNKIKETLKAQKRQMTENDISYKAIGVAIEIHTSIGFCPVASRFLRPESFRDLRPLRGSFYRHHKLI